MRRLFQFATAHRSRSAPVEAPPRAASKPGFAVYVYGVARRDGMVESAAPFVEGIIPGVPVEILPAGGYAVIASRAPAQVLAASTGGMMPTGASATAHHRALINLAMFADIVPVKAGLVLHDTDAAFDWLHHVSGSVGRALKRAGGAQEWGVRMFADMESCARMPVSSPVIAALEAGLQAASPTKAAAIRKQLLDECGREVLRKLAMRADNIHRHLLELVREGLANRLNLGADWNGVAPILVLDSAYLVGRGQEVAFNRYASELANTLYADGFSLELSGPWPAYSFTALDLKVPEPARL